MRNLRSRWMDHLALPALRWWVLVLALILLGTGLWLLLTDMPPVVVSWETGSEVGTAGFNVYRSPAWESQEAKRVNPVLIPAAGDETVGAAYRFEDRNSALTPGRRYRYQIEEVEWDGSATLYPEAVVARAGLPDMWTKIEGAGLIVLALLLTVWRWANRFPEGRRTAPDSTSSPEENL
jgi:hypothetical protein